MFWDRLLGGWRLPEVTPSDAGRQLARRSAAARAAADVPVSERRRRIIAELRRSGAVSPIAPRDEVVAPVRAGRARKQEQKHGR